MPDRDNFRNQKELRLACYKARLVLHRKHPTVDELREAALALNKAVRSLQSWLNGSNYFRRERMIDKYILNPPVRKETGPLIPLTYGKE